MLHRFVASCPEGSCLASIFNDVLVGHIEDKIRENIGAIDHKELSCVVPELNNLDSLNDLEGHCSNCRIFLTEGEWDDGNGELCFKCANDDIDERCEKCDEPLTNQNRGNNGKCLRCCLNELVCYP